MKKQKENTEGTQYLDIADEMLENPDSVHEDDKSTSQCVGQGGLVDLARRSPVGRSGSSSCQSGQGGLWSQYRNSGLTREDVTHLPHRRLRHSVSHGHLQLPARDACESLSSSSRSVSGLTVAKIISVYGALRHLVGGNGLNAM